MNRIAIKIDNNNQWFATVLVKKGNHTAPVKFKIDTGCNAVILSHSTLESLGYSAKSEDLEKLPSVTGKQVSGDKQIFKDLGEIALYRNTTTHICNGNAICHATHETNDLMGTEVFKQFTNVAFNLKEKYMELQ